MSQCVVFFNKEMFSFLCNSHFDSPSVTPIDTDHRSVRSGELKLGLYNVNQQHFVENGGSVSIDDRLSIELEYRGGLFDEKFS